VLLVHAIHVDDEELAYLAQTGTPVSLSILSELRVGMGILDTVAMMQAGVPSGAPPRTRSPHSARGSRRSWSNLQACPPRSPSAD
jgi:hypothetical protein